MALIRRGGCQFFIRSFRRNGRVTSRYLGSGEAALEAARVHTEARSRTEDRRRARSEELALWSQFDVAITVLCDLNRAHARAAMYAAGFYLHRRQWRRRGKTMGMPAKATASDVPVVIRERVDEFLCQNNQAEVSADDCVRFFDSIKDDLTPAAYSWVIKRLVGLTGRYDFLTPIDPRARAQQTLVRWLNEKWGHRGKPGEVSPADHELLRRHLDVLRKELADANAPLLEQMLADQVILCWAEVNGLTARTLELEQKWCDEDVIYFDKRRDRVTRRLHESIKLLHTIRLQAGPALQLTVNQCVAVTTPAAPVVDVSPAHVPASA
jgi:hypothetical protein